MLDTAIVGLGTVATWHRRALDRTPGARLTAVCDVDADRTERAAGAWDVEGYTDAEELLATAAPDWVHVCTPVSTHAPVAVPFLEAGVHALIEKPVTDSRRAFDRLTEAATAGDARMTVVHNQVFYPPLARARRLIADGRFGQLHGVSVRWLEDNDPTDPDRGDWVLELPGGELTEGIVHPVYVGLRSAGYPATEDAVAVSLGDSMDTEAAFDGLAISYHTADGVTCTIQHHAHAKGSRQVEFLAEGGRVVADIPTQSVRWYPRGYGANSSVERPLVNAAYWTARNAARAAGSIARIRARRAVASLRGREYTAHDTHTPVIRREARAIRGQGEGPTPHAEADWANRIFTTVIGAED